MRGATLTSTVDQARGLTVNSAGDLFAGSYYGGIYEFWSEWNAKQLCPLGNHSWIGV